jgi:uncharacterized membrane protein YphA (DoxX/SURF4 family)
MEIVIIIGRILFGGLMAFSGINHFTSLKKISAMARSKKVPAPTLATLVTGALLLLGGLSYLAWYQPFVGTVLLLVFFVPTTLFMNAFWQEKDPAKKENKMHGFMGNVSIIGLLLVILNFVS